MTKDEYIAKLEGELDSIHAHTLEAIESLNKAIVYFRADGDTVSMNRDDFDIAQSHVRFASVHSNRELISKPTEDKP
jgi:hypothetical protein